MNRIYVQIYTINIYPETDMEYYEMFYPIISYEYITWRLLSLSPTRAEPLAPYSRTHAAAQRERKERERERGKNDTNGRIFKCGHLHPPRVR